MCLSAVGLFVMHLIIFHSAKATSGSEVLGANHFFWSLSNSSTDQSTGIKANATSCSLSSGHHELNMEADTMDICN